MIRYAVSRLLWMIPLLVGISLLSFFMIKLAPGDITATETAFNPRVSQEVILRLQQEYHLDKPVLTQYWYWLKRMIRLDFGHSFSPHHRPIFWGEKQADGSYMAGMIEEALPVTLGINLLALLLILLMAVPLGVFAALHQGKSRDHTIVGIALAFYALPGFWLALLLLYFFGVVYPVFPLAGLTSLGANQFSMMEKLLDLSRHLFLPVIVLALTGATSLLLFVRSSMIESLSQEYIMTARAKGLKEKTVIWRHALINALLPVITILGLSLPGLISGSVIIENLFAIPGMGKLFYQGVMLRDYPLIMGIVVIGSILTLLGNFLADLAYAWADPRIRKGLSQ